MVDEPMQSFKSTIYSPFAIMFFKSKERKCKIFTERLYDTNGRNTLIKKLSPLKEFRNSLNRK